jgi:hypothetical protein
MNRIQFHNFVLSVSFGSLVSSNEKACQYVRVPLVAEYKLEHEVQFDGQQFQFVFHSKIVLRKSTVGKLSKPVTFLYADIRS